MSETEPLEPQIRGSLDAETEVCRKICADIAAEARKWGHRDIELGALRCAHAISLRLLAMNPSKNVGDSDGR